MLPAKVILTLFLTGCVTFGTQTAMKGVTWGVEKGAVKIAHVFHHPKKTVTAVVKHVAS